MTRRPERRITSRDIVDQLDHIKRDVHRNHRLLERIVSNQEGLNIRVQTLVIQFAQVQQAIEDLRNQPEAEKLDFSGLDAAVQAVAETVPDEGEPEPEPEPEPTS